MLADKIYNPSDMYSVFKAVTIEKSFCKMATRITARPTVEHVGYCRTYGSGVCPACQGEQNTVFERTVA